MFIPHTIATRATHLISAAVGDIDGNGWVDIVTSGMYGFPPFDRTGRSHSGETDIPTDWSQTGPENPRSEIASHRQRSTCAIQRSACLRAESQTS